MPYNPNEAPDREPLKFKNYVRGSVNEIITIQEAVERGRYREVPEGVDPNEPYLDLQYLALDAEYEDDGGQYFVKSGGRLFTRKRDDSGKYRMADKTQRPAQIAAAFRGLGIDQFPGDPKGKFDAWCAANLEQTDPCFSGIGVNADYDASKIIGNCFIVEKPPRNRENDKDPANFAAPLPTAVLGPDYAYTGEIRKVRRFTGEVNEDGAAAPAAASVIKLEDNDDVRATVLGAIADQPVAGLEGVVAKAGINPSITFGGESVLGLAISGKLVPALAAAGYVTVDDDVVKLVS